jgi:hypothetical protein
VHIPDGTNNIVHYNIKITEQFEDPARPGDVVAAVKERTVAGPA